MAVPLKFRALARTLGLSLGLISGCSQKASERWTVPNNPNPQTILAEAEEDADAKRHENALAKHIWYHHNALKIAPDQYGVRLSFALSAWIELGEAYPPALEKLRSVRDDAGNEVREGKASRDLFHDFAAINKCLKEDDKTKELFSWLDANNPSFAKSVFDIAEPSLIKAKEYRLCDKYLDTDAAFKRLLGLYREHKRIAEKPKFGKDMREFGEEAFLHGTTTLVALLTVNGRKDEAKQIAAKALSEWDNPDFKARLEKANNGKVPEPWP